MLHSSMKTIKMEHKFLCPHIIKIKDTYFFSRNMLDIQKVFVLLHLTNESASDILERRALLKLDLLIKFSQSLNTEKEE